MQQNIKAVVVLLVLGACAALIGCTQKESTRHLSVPLSMITDSAMENSAKQMQESEMMSDFSVYPTVDTLDLKAADKTTLFCYKNVVYARSYTLLDYAAKEALPLGQIHTFIGLERVPQKDFETNNKELLDAQLYFVGDDGAVVQVNGAYVLYDAVAQSGAAKAATGENKEK